MGLFEELSKALTPHSDKLNENLAFQASLLHHKMHAIERAVGDLGRPDIGDKWQRFQIKKKIKATTPEEIATCPINEIWLIQAISSDGVQEKTPAFVIESNGMLIESVIKEGLGFEGISGAQVVLPGEELTITMRAEGNVNCVITIVRRPYPTPRIAIDYGKDTDLWSHRNVHEIARDIIASRTGTYTEPGQEVDPTRGRKEGGKQVEILAGSEIESGRNSIKAVD